MNLKDKAREILDNNEICIGREVVNDNVSSVVGAMIEFAKLACEEQKKICFRKIQGREYSIDYNIFDESGCSYLTKEDQEDLNDSILNSPTVKFE